ncbi:Tat pathway signal protein [Bacterioplanes sanyensis]|uniref:Tat pathway signal protein n=1 Tax=Bacterioplanes sanyensis TaxID=1249553 RepID=A0A222FKG2_9GAMM|nr:PhoX family phosphatase [Bacterioplanes sanyensis]ASP39004.1 Tat pathway signal protein [Bacterioplanes sanyensis]
MTDNERELRLAEGPNYEPEMNRSGNTPMEKVIEVRLSRRSVLQSLMGATAVNFMGVGLAGCGSDDDNNDGAATGSADAPRAGFNAIPTSRADTVTLPEGYQWAPLIPWGTPITGSYPDYRSDGTNSGEEALQQIGSNHDGMHYFPLNDSSEHGLLVVNHEYIDQQVLHANPATSLPLPQDHVLKEMASHGVSVVEVQRAAAGGSHWEVVRGAYNRRVTALTEMEMTGPARGHDKLKTVYSPDGTRTRGTINNCSHGFTPWGTYLTCEENFRGYFHNTAQSAESQPREQSRYGIADAGDAGSWYNWDKIDSHLPRGMSERFDVSPSGDGANADYRNECNNFGWIVEIDPFDPNSMPKKRTALGRFAHEGIVFAQPKVGEPVVFYSGDDARFEYIYKFVSKALYREGISGDEVMNEGTLYVAKFNDDGSGEWLALDINDATFQTKASAANVSFSNQGDVLINARTAADVVGATPMDRPEWGAVCPRTGMVYFTLTNNTRREDEQTDAPNPRANNSTGHIIRWSEGSGSSFSWDIFLLGGQNGDGKVLPNTAQEAALDDGNLLSCPDGLWFDDSGLMWIQTDMSGSMLAGSNAAGDFGNNQMLAAEPDTGVIKRFLTGPNNCEVTGVVTTPDRRTMFVNLQHPGGDSEPGAFTSHFPANDGFSRPRSTTVVITRKDGGIIGS